MSEPPDGQHWYSLTWFEWAGTVGLVLTLLGLLFTWKQARDAKSAAEATRSAVQSTQRQLRANQLLVLIPQLRWIANALDESISDDEPIMARKHLENWRWSAAHVHGILSADGTVERDLLGAVQKSVGMAFSANTALIEGRQPLTQACKRARAAIGEACTALTTWAGSQSSTVETEGE